MTLNPWQKGACRRIASIFMARSLTLCGKNLNLRDNVHSVTRTSNYSATYMLDHFATNIDLYDNVQAFSTSL